MALRNGILGVLCLILGAVCLISIPQIQRYWAKYYAFHEPFYQSPLTSKTLAIRSDSYGKGYFGASRNGGRTHQGLDLRSPIGSPVLAAKSGRVSRAEEEKGYGKYVEIYHPDGRMTRYAHLSTIHVLAGQWIGEGVCLGLVGKTGNASNRLVTSHLHFEIRDQKDALNPTAPDLLDPTIVLK